MFYQSIWFQLFFILKSLVILECTKTWSSKPLISPAVNIPTDALHPHNQKVAANIAAYHNLFRTKVKPTASNMVYMTWDKTAAAQAQVYAEQCRFNQHNSHNERVVPELGSCGQNLYVSSEKVPWFNAIKSWFLEYRLFKFGNTDNELKAIGHYTQMVWATTHKVGCGFAKCDGGPWGRFYNYVCHYCPGGNIDTKLHFPYKPGKPCADCPDSCYKGLCTNACNKLDVYSNCAELKRTPYFDVCPLGMCNATCGCQTRIHKNHPWI